MTDKFRVGDWVRTSSLSEPMRIEKMFTAEEGSGHYWRIEHWAQLVSTDGTKHKTVKTYELHSTNMSKEETISHFNVSCINDLKKSITYYENLTGDKVLNISYDTESENIAIITKNLGLVKNIRCR